MENHELISFGDLPVSDLMHYGIKGMKWGIRKPHLKSSSKMKIGIQLFAKRASSRKTVRLPKQEFAHVMSELTTHITKEQRSYPTIIKHIGKYMYAFENNFDGTYRVIGKKRCKR